MIRGGAITGTVTNALGEPVVAVRVRATMVRDARGEVPKFMTFGLMEQSTDDRGIYRIYGLRPGTYIVSAGGQVSHLRSIHTTETCRHSRHRQLVIPLRR